MGLLLITSCGKKAEDVATATENEDTQAVVVPTQTAEEKARLAAEGERMRAASVEREKTVGRAEQEQLRKEAGARSAALSSSKSNSSSQKFLKTTDENCKNISGITQAFAEAAAIKYGVSTDSIQFIRFTKNCFFRINTPQGPRDCVPDIIVVNSAGQMLAHKDAIGSAMCIIPFDN